MNAANAGHKESIRPPEGRQHLLMAPGNSDLAKSLGATWDPELFAWSVESSRRDEMPRILLPTRDRPGLPPPYLTIALVPQTSWGRNIRALMGREAWSAFAKEQIYPSTGRLCRVCGGRGPEWPVEADEVWRYDDRTGVQSLHAIVPLCPACHEVRSAGFAVTNGRRRNIVRHLAWVERGSEADAAAVIEAALVTWRKRTRREWIIDLSHMRTRYGIDLVHDRFATDAIHDEIVADAVRRRGTKQRR